MSHDEKDRHAGAGVTTETALGQASARDVRADGDPGIEHIGAERLRDVRRGFATRRVTLPPRMTLLQSPACPQTGDLVWARVTSVGHHARLELTDGRRSQLYKGDEIVVAYANRYAPDQFEAEVPPDLAECHLVAAGGIASKLVSRHAKARTPTRIQPLGLLADDAGRALNLHDWKIDSRSIPKPLPPVVVVAGTAMNAGKTTVAARLIRGLLRAGKKVGAAKVTGTGAGGDYWQMQDAGAVEVVDFVDAGYASTYQLPPQEIEKVFLRLLSHLGSRGTDVIVVEVADGILQAETAALLASPGFAYYCDRLIFAASDAMGALAGIQWLHGKGVEVCAVSGTLSASPLAMRETATATGLPVLTRQALCEPETALELLAGN